MLLNNEMDDFALKPGTPNAFGVMGYGQCAEAGQAHAQLDDADLHGKQRQGDRAGHPGGSRIITMVPLGIPATTPAWTRSRLLRCRAITTSGCRT